MSGIEGAVVLWTGEPLFPWAGEISIVSDWGALSVLVTASVTCLVALRLALAPPLVRSDTLELNITLLSTA